MNTIHDSRILRFEGARNVRDLGGLPTLSGATTRFGVVYRADGLSRLTEQDIDLLASLNLRTIIDLRYEEERERAPDRVPQHNPPGFYFRGFFPRGTHALFDAVNVRGVGATEAAQLMLTNYARMPFEHADEFRDILHHIISPDSAPHLVHCTSGKDRTGLVVAFLLLALEVPRGVVFDDYALSNSDDWQAVDTFGGKATREAIETIMAAPPEYLQAAFGAIEERCGSLDDYLGQWLGFGKRERAALAELMLE